MADNDKLLSDAEIEALNALILASPTAEPLQALIVDDDVRTCDLLAQILELNGIKCQRAHSGTAALGVLATERTIGLMITDLRMKAMDGLDLIRKVRESERAALPIIITSGDAEVRDAIDAMHLSVVDFLLKPIDTQRLLELARRELGINPSQERL
ncbi:response regulator [Pseudomonas sp. R5(2019)]|uniref:response regulator n=1 Tax=Pseudomonas sp. R5(2019) TaxID=2697566 RepID=UPI001412A4F9|nr:response regulator [Pseudomonas sp. R5(2019)]NBA96370.1 response regulator [Pseudomonas sp. R5(2019)]